MKVYGPLDMFEGSHIRIEFRHCSSKDRERKLLGFSFLPLADNLGACIADGEHELYIYKCDDARKLESVKNYIYLPWGPKDVGKAFVVIVFVVDAGAAQCLLHWGNLNVMGKKENADSRAFIKNLCDLNAKK